MFSDKYPFWCDDTKELESEKQNRLSFTVMRDGPSWTKWSTDAGGIDFRERRLLYISCSLTPSKNEVKCASASTFEKYWKNASSNYLVIKNAHKNHWKFIF